MLVRFVGHDLDGTSGERVGIFQLAHDLLRSKRLTRDAEVALKASLDWFDQNLASPSRLSPFRDGAQVGYRGIRRRTPVAICWFKPEATEHVKHCWEIRRMLEEQGIAIEMIRTRKPGYVTHEDKYQIVAMPFSDER